MFAAPRLMVSLLPLLAVPVLELARAQDEPRVFQIGMIDSLFEETDEKQILAQMQPFVDQVKKRTGLNGEFVVVRGVDQMHDGLKSGKLALGVVLGHEYAWLRAGVPDAVPLVVAVNEGTTVKAHVLVHKDNPAKSLDELKQKSLALPKRTPRFARFYLEKEVKQAPAEFFQVKELPDADAAIEAVVEKEADATLVPSPGLNIYRQRKPGRFNRLKVLADSTEFPTPAVLYRPGTAREEHVKRFRDALLAINDSIEGRTTLTLWRLTGFQAPPEGYLKTVDALAKHYPRDAK